MAVRRVSDREARDLLSLNGKPGDMSGLEFPYIDPHTGRRVTSRIRRDHPPLRADGSPDGKYCAAYGDRRHLYFRGAHRRRDCSRGRESGNRRGATLHIANHRSAQHGAKRAAPRYIDDASTAPHACVQFGGGRLF